MKELVEFLAKQLVNHPEAVEVKETQGDTASVLELKVAKEDLGRVIGKQGRTAKSIRTILNAAASRTNRKVVLEIVEERGAGTVAERRGGRRRRDRRRACPAGLAARPRLSAARPEPGPRPPRPDRARGHVPRAGSWVGNPAWSRPRAARARGRRRPPGGRGAGRCARPGARRRPAAAG